jgi:hypothetical protein
MDKVVILGTGERPKPSLKADSRVGKDTLLIRAVFIFIF